MSGLFFLCILFCFMFSLPSFVLANYPSYGNVDRRSRLPILDCFIVYISECMMFNPFTCAVIVLNLYIYLGFRLYHRQYFNSVVDRSVCSVWSTPVRLVYTGHSFPWDLGGVIRNKYRLSSAAFSLWTAKMGKKIHGEIMICEKA